MREGVIAGTVFNVAYIFITLKILWLQISSPKTKGREIGHLIFF